jgi:hypothetical protein
VIGQEIVARFSSTLPVQHQLKQFDMWVTCEQHALPITISNLISKPFLIIQFDAILIYSIDNGLFKIRHIKGQLTHQVIQALLSIVYIHLQLLSSKVIQLFNSLE